jgi:hypothetical protein
MTTRSAFHYLSMGTTAARRSALDNQHESTGHSPSGSKVFKIGEMNMEAEPPKLADLTRPVWRWPLRVLGWFGGVQVVLERFGTLRGGSMEIGSMSVGVTSASNSDSSESLRGANPPKRGELTSNSVRDLWRGRRAPEYKVRVGRVALIWEWRRLFRLGVGSLRPSI